MKLAAAVVVLVAMVWGSAALCAPHPVIADDFGDPTLSKWLWMPRVQGTGTSVAERDQRVQVEFAADAADDPSAGISRAGYVGTGRLKGDFDIQVSYTLLTWPSKNGVRVGLVTSCGDIERTSRGTVADFAGTPDEVYSTNIGAEMTVTDLWTEGRIQISATDDRSGKLRLVRSDGRMVGYADKSGQWAEIGGNAVRTDDAEFALMVWSHNDRFTGQRVVVAFDDFVVNSGTLVLSGTTTPVAGSESIRPTAVPLGPPSG